jgi:hypothetical protein
MSAIGNGIKSIATLVSVFITKSYTASVASERVKLRERKVVTWEAALTNGTDEFEESNTVIGVLGKVLVDHVQCHIEHRLQNNGDAIIQQRLFIKKAV